MKTLHCQKYLLLILLVLPMSLVRCKASDAASFLPSATIEMVPSPESMPLLDKPTPVHAPEKLTQRPLPTRTPRSYTPTPAPTLTTSEEQILISSLFQNNAGCQLPCWWGFTPGETTWQTAQEFFALLGEFPDAYRSPRGTVNYTMHFRIQEQISQEGEISHSYIVRDDIIEMIWAIVGQTQTYALPQLLANYGQPTSVWLRTFSAVADTDEGELPFFLLLHYQQYGFLVRYVDFTYAQDGQISICPQQAGGALWLWSPERKMTLEDIAYVGVGGFPIDEVPDYRSLTEATGMSIEQFYEVFVQPVQQFCLEVPLGL